ncbi:MAG TPA: glycosyltransferase family 4 protein, partial [Chloroflexota bacterium]|nr:glycosyltransferase family 4 protein [Chloroflexota bacterium]
MKVLFIASAYPRAAEDIITPWLVEMIRRLQARGIVVEVLAPAYRGLGNQILHDVQVHRFRYAPARWETLTHDQTAPDRIRQRPLFLALVPFYILAGSFAAARLARSGAFDLVHVFWPMPHGIIGIAAKSFAGVPLVCTFFGVELTWVDAQLPFLRPVIGMIVRASDAIT